MKKILMKILESTDSVSIMKVLFYLFLFVFSFFTAFSQDTTSTPEASGRSDVGELKDSSGNSTDLEIADDMQGLDREFYTTYFLMDPLQYEKKEEKAKREENIIRVFKREISNRDPYNKDVITEITPSSVKIVRVSDENSYIKKFKKRVTHLRLTEYMYIAKFKNYICLMFFEASPGKYYITPTFVELVFPRNLLLE
jgi:hypothetical protein